MPIGATSPAMAGTPDRKPVLADFAATLETAGRDLHGLIETMRRAIEAEAMREMAHSPRPEYGGAQIRAPIAARRLRRDYLGLEEDEPGWTLLLELLAARVEGRPLTITGLGEAARLPPTTSLRWIGLLERRGLIARRPHPEAARAVLVSLTDETEDRMRAYLTAALSMSPWVL